jgi:hypothetical protein
MAFAFISSKGSAYPFLIFGAVFLLKIFNTFADIFQDGLNDFYEILYGTNPRLPDSNGDGWLDKTEIDAGSDPNNYS